MKRLKPALARPRKSSSVLCAEGNPDSMEAKFKLVIACRETMPRALF